jgi:hypothetical protein
MGRHKVTAEAELIAPADQIYQILADYRHGHPRILPRPPFASLEVEEGGVGSGTVIRFTMRLMGRSEVLRGVITEPEQGRVLVETYPETGTVTTFTVDPLGDRQHSRVQISTELEIRGGILGKLQRALITQYLRATYKRELKNLEAVVQEDLKRESDGVNQSTPESASPH